MLRKSKYAFCYIKLLVATRSEAFRGKLINKYTIALTGNKTREKKFIRSFILNLNGKINNFR